MAKGERKIGKFLLFCIFCSGVFCSQALAQESNPLAGLAKKVIEAKSKDEAFTDLTALKDLYFKENKYSEFVKFLQSLSQKKKALEPLINYYVALARYQQLKYLEEQQDWNEYFGRVDEYRQEINRELKKALDLTPVKDPLYIYAGTLLWALREDNDEADEAMLSGLLNSVLEYSKEAADYKPIKEAADKFSAYGRKIEAKQLYRLYVDKLVNSGINNEEELKRNALVFYQEGNLNLSEALYDAYIESAARSLPKEKLIPVLIEIAGQFCAKTDKARDAQYAEKVFQKIEDMAGQAAFSDELAYLRAFNLEKSREYARAREGYAQLLKLYPQTSHADEANFKIGMISVYLLRDLRQGREYFEKLASQETTGPQVTSALYQLGLLSQWEGDSDKAREYYEKLIAGAKADFTESVNLANQRLKEITEAKPLEYNLKTFLDVSLKDENKIFDMSKANIKPSLVKLKKAETVDIGSDVYQMASGCLQVEVQYLWSGHLGCASIDTGQANFNTTYISPGNKEVNLVVVSPSGIIDRSMEILDVD